MTGADPAAFAELSGLAEIFTIRSAIVDRTYP
jgi:hypothetical protein